jgi:AraC-like DNA-binding protein/mannose-6-phosphate isomerase-like protein (cupin superfamily)
MKTKDESLERFRDRGIKNIDEPMRLEVYDVHSTNLDIDLIHCGYEDCVPDFICKPHIRPWHLIHYIMKGRGFFEMDGKKYSLKKGDIFTIYPGHVVTYYAPDPEDPWSFCWFGFAGKKVDKYLASIGVTINNPVIGILPEYDITKLVKMCTHYLNENNVKLKTKILGYLYSIFANFEESQHKKNVKLVPNKVLNEHVLKALFFIENSYMDRVSAKDVVKYVGIERTHLWRLFHRYSNTSIRRYIINYRIEKAIQLMKTTEYKLSAICEYVGMVDQYYFSRIFKKVMGVSPARYRDSL